MNKDWVFWLSRTLLAVLLGVLCWGLVSLVWFVVSPPKAQTPNVPQTTSVQQTRATAPINLFDSTSSHTLRLPQGLSLEGVMISSNAESSRAFFNHQSKLFGVKSGGPLEGVGLTLGAVEASRVQLFDAAGSSGWLELKSQGLELNQPFARSGTSASAQPTRSVPAPAVQPSSSERLRRALGRTQASAEDTKTKMLEDPQKFVDDLGLVSTGSGYQITGSTSQRTRAQYGLRPGDQVISINGNTLGDPQTDAQMIQNLDLTQPLEVVIQRGSGTITIRPRLQ